MVERVYVFDLDRVLYPLDSSVYDQSVAAICERGRILAGLTHEEFAAFYAQHANDPLKAGHAFCQTYGFTSTQMLDNYHEVLDYGVLEACLETREKLERLKGRRVIYTDGTKAHAEKVLAARGFEGLFDEIHDISLFKTQKRLVDFKEYMRRAGVDGASVTFIEDSLYNLVSAHAAGVRTVWINGATAKPAHVVEMAPTLLHWLEAENLAEKAA